MTRDEVKHDIVTASKFAACAEADQALNRVLDHDAAQRQVIEQQAQEIGRLQNILCSVDKDHAVQKLNKVIERLEGRVQPPRPAR